MSENKTPGDKTLSVSAGKTLTLKRPVEQGTVRQSFSHGRTKAVVVETVKRRAVTPGAAEAPAKAPAPAPPPQPQRALSSGEQAARAAAVRQAQEEEARRRAAVQAALASQQAAARAEAQERPRPVAEAPARPVEPPPMPAPVAAPVVPPPMAPAPPPTPVSEQPTPPSAPPKSDLREGAAAAPRAPVVASPARPAVGERYEAPRGYGDRPPRLDSVRPASSAPRPDPERSARGEADRGPRAGGFGDRPPRTEGFGDRNARPAGAGYGDRGPRPEGDRGPRPAGTGYGDRGPRPEGDRGPRPSGTSYGDRGPRPEGDRGLRPAGAGYGDRGPRPTGTGYGDRGPRPEGDRGPRPGGFGDRGPRPAGTGFADRGPRPEGERGPRPGGFGDRPPRPPGDRPPRAPGAAPARFGFGRAPAAPEVPLVQEARRSAPPAAGAPRARSVDVDGDAAPRRGPASRTPAAAPKAERAVRGGEDKRRALTVTNAFESEDERTRSVAAFRRRVQRMKGGADETKEKIFREVTIPETITIQELANRMSERAVDIIRLLMKQGQMHKITDVIDADTAQLIAEEMGHSVRRVAEADVEEGLFDAADEAGDLEPRPPVVTIMGHVDHGKTSLLDAIRETNVVSGEAGGITQHIGAYQVVSPLGGLITFIDTPGHAAFTAMRARGARVTDIVVLVVAANDSVMPQTVEAISHARAAKVPMIVAINKIDLPDARPDRVRSDLLQHEVVVESLGGDTIEVEVSAKTGKNLDKLLEAIQLQAEVLELRANPQRAAEGTVVEAKLDRGRGPVATVLVQRGTLHQGDIVVAGSEWGRVRALVDDKGVQTAQAGPSTPVEILGFNGAPEAGDRVAVVESEARAREITEYRIRQKREKAAARGATAARSLADMLTQIKTSGKKELALVVKADVQGSVEAIEGALEKLGTDEVVCRVLHAAVGGVTESDVTLAHTSGAVILGFNIRAHKEAREAAERHGIEIRYYNVIYDLVDDVKAAMSGLLAPTLREEMLGNAEIREVFTITKVGKVAGCLVTDGKVERGAKVRLIRDNVVIHEGTLKTLKRFKDEVKEVLAGQECGMAFERYEDIRQGDIIECYRVEEIKRTL